MSDKVVNFGRDLLKLVDIVKIIGSRINLNKNYFARCPFHSDKTASFSVSRQKQIYHCFGCGVGGNAITFVMAYNKTNYNDAVRIIADECRIKLPERQIYRNSAFFDKINSMHKINQKVADFYHQNLLHNIEAQKYLNDRGIDLKTIKKFYLGLATNAWQAITNLLIKDANQIQISLELGLLAKGKNNNYYDVFRDRIIFPIRQSEKIIGFGGRIFPKQNQAATSVPASSNTLISKYINSKESLIFKKFELLYGVYEMHDKQNFSINKNKTIIIVEGYMDVVSLHKFGINFAVATLGTSITQQHLIRIFKMTDEVIFCFDGDAAGLKAAKRALDIVLDMHDGTINVRFIILPINEDPDSILQKFGAEVFLDQMQKALNLEDFLFNIAYKAENLASPHLKQRYTNEIINKIKKIPSEIYKEILLNKLAKITELNRKILDNMLEKNRSSNYIRIEKNDVSKENIPEAERKIISILMQEISMAKSIPKTFDEEMCKSQVLKNLIKYLKNNLDELTNPGLIIEKFRDEKNFQDILLQYSAKNLFDAKKIILVDEFLGNLLLIKRNYIEEQINKLIAKGKNNELKPEEKKQLQNLIVKLRSLKS